MFDMNAELHERIRRWTAFMTSGAPPGFLFVVRKNEPDWPPRPPLWPENQAARTEWIWDDYCRHLGRVERLRDDHVPSLNMLTGTEIFAEALGCRVHRPEDNMPFALPLIRTPAEVARVRVPELSRSSLAYLFDMADELRRRAGPDALFRMVDMQSPMDIAALVMDKAALFVAMLEAPEAVKELALKARQLLTAFLDEWFRRYGVSFVAHFPDYCMPRGVTLSEDEIGAVNEDMFEEFFLPGLDFLSQRYGGIGIHCCATARHQWAGLARVKGLRLLNIGQAGVAADAYPYFAPLTVQWHARLGGNDVASWPAAQYPGNARFILETDWINDWEEAETAAATLHAARTRRAPTPA